MAVPKLKAPKGTCDTHLHIFGPRDRYPLAPTAVVKPPPSPVADYRPIMERLGIDRAVIVQPSGYGTDNRCTMDAVGELGLDVARAIVTVDHTVSDAELERLTTAGARGIRFHMLPGGVLPWDILETMAARVQAFGWHVQLQMDGRLFPEREALLKRLPGTLVIDHTGKFLEPVSPDHPGMKVLLGLVGSGRVWVKLSAPYETSKTAPPDYPDVMAMARPLLKAAPERMVWASNWPHVGKLADPPDDAMLLDVLLHWCPDEAVRRKILVDNPARLYGFA